MANVMLRESFKQVKQQRGVTGKAIYELTGISQNHISEYLRGKRDVTSETLSRMINAMEQVSPGAKQDFARLVADGLAAGSRLHPEDIILIEPEEVASLMNPDQKARWLMAIAATLKSNQTEKVPA